MKFQNFTKNELQTKSIAQRLINLRRKNLPLIYGDTKILIATDKTFAYARMYFDDITVVVFNKDSSPKDITIKLPERYADIQFSSNFASDWTYNNNIFKVTVKPYSFEIFTNKLIYAKHKIRRKLKE